ncbi:MAG: hypothetical protein HF978_10565 [Desulfobacteraceae bacterium]|nr:hypothetical protein [Desulfobacteraceae bacterium]MBC2755977.1 hypothetical protein [Desulfobacteraceae bacterium]
MKSMFRYLVVFSMSIYALWFFIPYVTIHFSLYSKEISDILSWTGLDALIGYKAQDIIGYIFLFSFLVVSVGLFKFKIWAKIGFILLTLISIFATPLSGLMILPVIDSMLFQIMNLADGIIISLMYFSSLRNEFH